MAAVQVIGRNADSKQFAEASAATGSSRAVASPHHTQESVRAPFKSLLGTEVDESVVEAACAYDEKVDTSALLAVCGYVAIPFELQLGQQKAGKSHGLQAVIHILRLHREAYVAPAHQSWCSGREGRYAR